MGTLFYSPGVRIIIRTAKSGIVDVTEDITSGSLELRVNATHSLTFSLANTRRKYDRVFTPNDPVVVRMRRLAWVQTFSGYLDTVPFFSVYPRETSLEASCTLKRLKMTYWDPGASAVVTWLNDMVGGDFTTGGITGNLTQKTIKVLTNVVQWPQDAIHIGTIPNDWINRVEALSVALKDDYGIAAVLLGPAPVINGQSALDLGVAVDPSTPTFAFSHIPNMSGTVHIGVSDTPRSDFYFTGESKLSPNDPYWCAIRATGFRADRGGQPSPDEALVTALNADVARTSWRNKQILVVNEATAATVVLRVADWGPAANDVICISPTAAAILGVTEHGQVALRYAKLGASLGGDGSVGGVSGDVSVTQDSGAAQPGQPFQPILPAGSVTLSTVTWAPADGLVANVRAARDFGRSSWVGLKSIGGFATHGHIPGSDHYTGHALDFMVSTGKAATGSELALGNSIALWFTANPHVFNVKYVIWFDRINTGTGWRPYGDPSSTNNTKQHRDHPHVSFYDQASVGVTGGAWPGGDVASFSGGFSGSGPTTPGFVAGPTLFNARNWQLQIDGESDTLTGERALMNDVPVKGFVQQVLNSSMRDFCSAPNGDFIAWFPDYFGIYGLAGVMSVRNIEVKDFTVVWNDESLITHQYTAGSQSGYGSNRASVELSKNKVYTMGIATVEHPEILQALLNISPNDPDTLGWIDPHAILNRFGARPDFQAMEGLTDARSEFWYALHLFQRNWANQFSAHVPLTFMPEIFPGMLLRLEDYGVQFYVDGVNHSWSYGPGGGFTTTAHISAPSSVDGKGFLGFVKGGSV